MVTTLPQAEWLKREDLAALIAALGSGEARYVGGAVRDTLLGIPVRDVDLATPLEPQAVMQRLQGAGIQAVPTGIEHGTVTAVSSNTVVEVTTLRADVSRQEARLREARAEFLHQVARHGFIENYSGVRIAKDGSRFLIEQATVWNVVDIALPSDVLGQAVLIKKSTPI